MQSFGILLIIMQLMAGQITDTQTRLFNLFNILSPSYSSEELAATLNALVGPIEKSDAEELTLDAKAAIVIDNASGKVLYDKSSDKKLPIASITKLMTALVAIDNLRGDMSRTLTVPEIAARESGSQMDLVTGERITAQNLLRGLLIQSANDAAVTFANTTTSSYDLFIQQMNTKAATLGLSDTHFANATGFDAPEHYSTAKDLAKLAQYALQNENISEIVATPRLTVLDVTQTHKHTLTNTNQLVGKYANIIGVKTGTTGEAGPSLITAAKGSAGQMVITVLLDSPDRFAEGKTALDWALANFSWITPV